MAINDLIPWKREKRMPVRQETEQDHDPFYAIQRDVNRMFDDFFSNRFGLAPWDDFGGFSPSIDVLENDKEFRVTAELPGLDEKDVEVSLSGDMLTISGEKKAEKEDKGQNYYRTERSYGSFQRTVTLPSGINPDKVEASFKQGILTVTVPKSVQAGNRKKITIKA